MSGSISEELTSYLNQPINEYTGLAHCMNSQCANRTLREVRLYVYKFTLCEHFPHYAYPAGVHTCVCMCTYVRVCVCVFT